MNNKLINPMGSLFDQFFNQSINSFVGNDMVVSRPQANIVELDDHFSIDLAIPGMEKDQINIEVKDDHLIVSAEVKNETNEDTGSYKRREFSYASFERRFTLNDLLDKENIEAKYENGILNVRINKLEQAISKKPLKIEIH